MFNKLLLLGLILVGCLCSSAIQAQDCPTVGFDADGDLSIGVSDLVQFLGVFGQNLDQDGDGIIDCEDPCIGDSTACPWSCGDDLEYFGYAYQTVAIGDQCWFSENLRTLQYANGDSLLHGLTNSEWEENAGPFGDSTANRFGAASVYYQFGSEIGENCLLPVGDTLEECDSLLMLNTYGRLYNFFAVVDARNLCPTGWHVPSIADIDTLASYLDSQGFQEVNGFNQHATALKSTYGWAGNGTDNFGFTALPGGWRGYSGMYLGRYYDGYWWTSTASLASLFGPRGNALRLTAYNSETIYLDQFQGAGMSVRCIKD